MLFEIGIYLTTKCNLNCSYCYAKNDFYPDIWQQEWTDEQFKKIKIFLSTISKNTNQPLNIILLGGEPLLSKHFENILYFINNLKNINKIYLFTNFTKPNYFFDIINKYQNLIGVISYHYEYFKNISDDDFFMICKEFKKLKERIRFDILIPEDFKLIQTHKNKINYIQKNFNYNFEFITKSNSNYIDLINKLLTFEFLKEKDINLLKNMKKDYNQTINCNIRPFNLHFDGIFEGVCTNYSFNIFNCNIIDYKQEIKKIKRIINSNHSCQSQKICECIDLYQKAK